MKLAYWMYAGPAHIGTLRVTSSFNNVHAIMHAPLGDDYFNVMRSMLERKKDFTPVTASVVDRHVLARGSQEKVVNNITRKDREEHPDLVVLTPTCTSSILQEDLQNFVERASLDSEADVMLADVNHYRFNEIQAADRTLAQIVKFYIKKAEKQGSLNIQKTTKPSVNIIGSLSLGFHNQHDMLEMKKLFADLGVEINLIIPENANVYDLEKLPKAWFNFIPYREVGQQTADFLKERFDMPFISQTPMGILNIASTIREVQSVLEAQHTVVDFEPYIEKQTKNVSQSAWFSRSIDCQNLTGKRAIVFGDSTHAAAMTKILHKEMGINVILAGTYCLSDEKWFRKETSNFCEEVLVTEDHALIGDMISKLQPDAIFGTQMERHIGKRLSIPCGVISSPVHIQNFPLSYRPFLGYEGTNQIADLIYNSFTLGMEDHLLEVFGGHDTSTNSEVATSPNIQSEFTWSPEASKELQNIPGFVRGKIKVKTEKYAAENKISVIDLETMYAAKEANTV